MRVAITFAAVLVASAPIARAVEPEPHHESQVPPSLGDSPVAMDPTEGNPGEAQDRFQRRTRPKSDVMLGNAVEDRLRAGGYGDVAVDADEGVVTLRGAAASADARARAERIADETPGVRAVQNELAVPGS